jgi:D-3-phosphoglycerate dehydrogenase
MPHALVDRDIQPMTHLESQVGDRFTLDIGGETDREALIASLQGADLILTTSRLPVDRTVLERTDLELVAKLGAGLDNVDLDAAAELEIPVTHTPGLNARAVAEHTVLMALAVSRELLPNARHLEAGGWRDDIGLGSELADATVGIVGFGRIGSRVAGLLSGFNADVLAYDPYVFEEDTEVTGGTLTDLETLLSESDVVTVNAELTPETEGLLGAAELDRMPASSYLVNTARGPIVDEDALIAALENDEIAGAALDVFETEPLPADSRLHDFENVVATPHVASSTERTRTRTIDRLVESAVALLSGDPVPDRYMAVSVD